MLRWLERCLVIADDELPDVADVVIGIGIDVSKDGEQASPYSKAVASKCLQLFNADKVQNILFTGGYSIHLWPVTEARAMCDEIAWQVPWENIYLEQDSYRTYLNADYTFPIVQEAKWKKVIIIAQQWHARRVLATFKKRWKDQGIKIYIVKAWSDYGGGSQKRLNYFFTFLLWDTLSFFVSKIKGWC
ncbi:MAG: YdcF family protein [bacterium]|nr:YdcF family protein [bacterium]